MKKQFLVVSFFCTTSLLLSEEVKKTVPENNTNKTAENSTVTDTGAVVVPKPGTDYIPGACGFRKALGGLVKVYQICFFGKNMKAAEWVTSFEAPANTKSFKLKLEFLRGVGGKAVSAAFSESLSKSPVANKLEDLERQKFIGWSAKLKIEKNSVMEFTFVDTKPVKVEFFEKPNSGTQPETFVSDQKGLAKSIAAIWYGDKPINEDLKKELLK